MNTVAVLVAQHLLSALVLVAGLTWGVPGLAVRALGAVRRRTVRA